jgi:signal peptidase I
LNASRKYLDAALVGLATLLCALLLKVFVVEAFRIPSSSMENTLQVGDLVLVNKLAYGLRTPGALPFTSVPVAPAWLFSTRDVRRGDVIVFEFTLRTPDGLPADVLYYVKRCVGLPGDTVEIRSGQLYINGRELLAPSTALGPSFQAARSREARFPEGSGFTDRDYGPIRVPKAGDTVLLEPATSAMWLPLLQRDHRTVEFDAEGIVFVDGEPRTSVTLEQDMYFVLGDHRDNSWDSRMWGFVPHRDIFGEALLVYWSMREPEERGETGGGVRWDRIGTLIR